MTRRRFLGAVGLTGASLLGSTLLASMSRSQTVRGNGYKKPNILVIIVDQLRTPQHFPSQDVLDGYLPNLAALRKDSVSFNNYYTASIMCTPARGTLLTGLYSHQTFLMGTQRKAPVLQHGFSTWGHMLQHLGYEPWWFGKWHLSHTPALTSYGFQGGTFPSPDGAPGQGYAIDPFIVNGGTPPDPKWHPDTQFAQWISSSSRQTPWCTTVSLVNPHDISFYYKGTEKLPEYQNPPQVFNTPLLNYETTEQLLKNKPGLQADFQHQANRNQGPLPSETTSDGSNPLWYALMNTYLKAQQYADGHVGEVLSLLETSGHASDTIVLFLADHGEHAGSHGLRAKGASCYHETMSVPLYIKDPTGQWGMGAGTTRDQMYSSVDITPLLLTLATGDGQWRKRPALQHLGGRADIAASLTDPSVPGRPYVLHATDEVGFEKVPSDPKPNSPSHIIALVTPKAKLGTYSHWDEGTVNISSTGRQFELYDYTKPNGWLEIDNVATAEPELVADLSSTLFNDAVPNELRQPVPAWMQSAQQAAIADYLSFEVTVGGADQ